MKTAALFTWACTALAGMGLLAIWLIEYDLGQPGGTASRLPKTVIGGHALLALSGFVTWVVYLITGWDVLAWIVLAVLAVVASLGSVMLGRWVTVRRSIAAVGGRHHRPPGRVPLPAESHFPLPLVIGHGVLAVSTVTLVALTCLHLTGG